MSELQELARHLERSPPEGHGDLDKRLALLFDDCHDENGEWVLRPSEIERDRQQVVFTPPYTYSLTDAVALIERALPGWAWQVRKIDGFKAAVAPPGHRNAANAKGCGDWITAHGESAPLALLIAMVQARTLKDVADE